MNIFQSIILINNSGNSDWILATGYWSNQGFWRNTSFWQTP